MRELATPAGPARALVWRSPASRARRGTLVLGHGAGGRAWTADLLMLTSLAAAGWSVVLVEQPWRVAGRRLAAPPAILDQAWLAVVPALLSGRGRLPRPLVSGGRSAGARVACRTAGEVGANAVLALAFPLHYPGGRGASRAGEARQVTEKGVPLLVIQGARDPFGRPEEVHAEVGPGAEIVAVSGAHSFGARPTAVLAATESWLERVLPGG